MNFSYYEKVKNKRKQNSIRIEGIIGEHQEVEEQTRRTPSRLVKTPITYRHTNRHAYTHM